MKEQLLSWCLKILIFFAVVFVYTKFGPPLPLFISSVNTTKTDTYQVSGTGKASIQPDSATVNLGVAVTGKTAKDAQDQMNSLINKVVDAIKGLGVENKDIKTENYSVYPIYEESQRISGYSGNTAIIIKVNDISKVNEIIDTATTQGANQVGGANFEVKDRAKAENEARKLAVEDARKKAQETAKMVGFKLGRIINYSEGPLAIPMLERDYLGKGGGGEPTQIEPGSNEVVINVTLSYEIL